MVDRCGVGELGNDIYMQWGSRGRIGGHNFQWFRLVLFGDCFPPFDLLLVVEYF